MNKYLHGIKAQQKELFGEVVETMFSERPELRGTLSEKLMARSWGVVCRDVNLLDTTSNPEDILRHVSGELFMASMTAEGDTVIVSRRIKQAEEGSDEYTQGTFMLDNLYGLQNRLVALSDACSGMRTSYQKTNAFIS